MKFRVLVIALLIYGCSKKPPEYEKLSGFTQGGTYHTVFENKRKTRPEKVSQDVKKILNDIDMSLSVYNDSSVISRLNRNEKIAPDYYFKEVFMKSKEISQITGGAFDITVGPLVRAWGFGPDNHKYFDRSKLDSLMRLVGFSKVNLVDGNLVKSDPGITLDVNAIAQGFTVDVICRYFDKIGIKSYLVEVGGEVRVKGRKGTEMWKIGIDKPVDSNNVSGNNLQAIVKLEDEALATSGNYRKFYIEDGVKYSHIIDPKTGYPARNKLLSASIFAHDCATADGIATACMVMGLEKSIDFISSDHDYEAFLVYSDDHGNLLTWISEKLKNNLSEEALN
jgi:thiamine biosynthesis lipoprotein